MKHLLLFSFLFTFSFILQLAAQEPTEEQTTEQIQRQIEAEIRWMNSPIAALNNEADYRCISPYNGQGTWQAVAIMYRTDGKEDLALSEEQTNALPFLRHENEITREYFQRMQQQPSEEFTSAVQAVRAAIPPDDPFFEKASEEQKQNYVDAQHNMLMLSVNDLEQQIDAVLTPEQMLKADKLEMQLAPEFGIPYPSMFEVLDLSDEQKKDMKKIADEMEPEYEKLLKESAALRYERIHQYRRTTAEQHKEKPFTSLQEFRKATNEAAKTIKPLNREKTAQLQEKGIQFTTRLKSRLMNVLTDEQLDKMQKIMDETPNWAKELAANMRKERERMSKNEQYTPGPESWKPGDGTPKEFKEQRKTRPFPSED